MGTNKAQTVSAISLLGKRYTKSWADADMAVQAARKAKRMFLGFILLEDFGQCGFQGLTVEITGHDGPFRIYQQVVRNCIDAIQCTGRIIPSRKV